MRQASSCLASHADRWDERPSDDPSPRLVLQTTRQESSWHDHGLALVMRTSEVDSSLVDVYVKEQLSARELYVRFRHTGVTWQEVRDVLRASGLMRKQGTTVRGRSHKIILCKDCSDKFKPESSRQLRCDKCRPEYVLNNTLKNGYGITREQYDALLIAQDNACAICKTSFGVIWEKSTKNGQMRRTTRIDHDHRTGHVRGLLCNRCNINLRGLDDKEWHSAALAYIQR